MKSKGSRGLILNTEKNDASPEVRHQGNSSY